MRVYHFKRKDGRLNFGDDLSPAVISHVLNLSVQYSGPQHAEIMSVGSILSYWSAKNSRRRNFFDRILFRQPIAVFGSGIIAERPVKLPNCEILALRGPLTQKHLGLENVAIHADPGLLASRLVPKVNSGKQIGIVPHYVDKQHAVIAALELDPQFKIIDVERPWADVLMEISQCSMVLSSSLHGLIASDSYGIPNVRITFSDQIVGGDFKFFDYGLSVDRGHLQAKSIGSVSDIFQIIESSELTQSVIDPEINELKQVQLMSALRSWYDGRSGR